MKNWRGLSLRYLKSQKKRTVLIIIGIALSVSMLSAAGVFGESLKSTMLENIRRNYGDFHALYSGIDQSQLSILQNHAKVAGVGYTVRAGIEQIAPAQTLIVTGANQEFCRMMYLSLQSGNWPQKDNEIAIERWVLDSLKIKPQVGDRITLDLSTAGKLTDLSEGDSNKGTEKHDFVLTGILKNRDFMSSGVSMGIVTIKTAKQLMNTTDLRYTAHVLVKPGLPIQPTITELQNSLGLKDNQVSQNSALLTALSQSSDNKNNTAVLIIEGIAMLVILVTSIAVIYNAFHISVLERIHQFGVLRSIGSTPGQIRAIVLGEALAVSMIAIPIGLSLGALAVKAVIGIFATRFSNFPNFQVVFPLWILAGTALLGLVTVLASAYGPARTAGKISPMEAILNNARQKIGTAKRGKHSLLAGILGIEGVMAYEKPVIPNKIMIRLARSRG